MTINQRPGEASQLLDYLPAIFQQGSKPGESNFIGRFLLAFERILLGLGEVSEEIQEPGLEEILGGIVDPDTQTTQLAGIQRYFEPGVRLRSGEEVFLRTWESAPTDFLPWLAGWVALTLRQDWTEEEKRRFISRIVPLYRQRGTKKGLRELLSAYTGLPRDSVEIYELTQPLQVGITSKVGVDTAIGSGPPHFFMVKMSLSLSGATDFTEERSRKEQIARSIIDQEKPAHTYYELLVQFPTIQVGVTSTVGKDTLLGIPPN